HESHAASAFFPSPFDEAVILTLDGVAEWSTAAYGVGVGNRLRLSHHLQFPHSLGLLYSAFTYYCGFKVNSGEYKLMGLAPYGQPIYRDKIYEHLVDLKADGSLGLNMDYFNYGHGLSMTSPRFHELFGGPPRSPESRIEQHHMDLAASIQAVAEDAVLRMGGHVRAETGQKRLVMAGGVALNCVANGRLMREGPFDDIWVEPAADWFEMRAGESPYMMLVAPVRKEHHVPIGVHDSRIMRQDPDLTARINVVRSTVPAVTHVDFSARVQTVDRARHPRFYRLLEAFHSLTGCPVLVNTSFNVRGEPIVCTPQEAHRCYRATGIDALVLEDFVLVKSPGAPEA